MHELSIVLSILETVEEQARTHNALKVESLDLVIGSLSGVEMEALEFAWEVAVPGTILAHTKRNILAVQALARCTSCKHEFNVNELFEPCPECGSFRVEILKGKELQIKSLTLVN